MKNKGALTKGITEETSDYASSTLIDNLILKLKNDQYQFKPIKRIYIDKTKKDKDLDQKIKKIYLAGQLSKEKLKELKARPLGIPTFTDKILQEAIRVILEAIYEPEFKLVNRNFGFRKGVGTQTAIENIKIKAKAMTFAIEGDVQGAFDSVNFEILLKILNKRIKDQKFLKLIKKSLECGIVFADKLEQSVIGTTQGSVLSPMLYNIYFNEFDKFINNEFQEKINLINQTEKRVARPARSIYNSISKKKFKLTILQKAQNLKESFYKLGKDSPEFQEKLKRYNRDKAKWKELDKRQKLYPAFSKKKQTIRFSYIRYADDWVFFTNATLERTLEFKEIFAQWIENNLKLTLSPEKTKITNLTKGEKVRFLGFQLSMYKTKRILNIGKYKIVNTDLALRRKKKKIKFIPENDQILQIKRQRTTNPSLIIAWDRTRVLPRLEEKRFIRKKHSNWRGRSKSEWTTLEIPEIIERYNYIIRGYVEYYCLHTTYQTDIHQLFYLLKYSCAHTLANKLNTKLSTIFKRFGKHILIHYIEKTEIKLRFGESKTKTTEVIRGLYSWETILHIIRVKYYNAYVKKVEKEQIHKNIDDIANVKVNWRTSYKLSKYCSICGSTKDIQMHHVKHIKIGKVTGFLQVMKQLNRKQIPCCADCHRKIHKGEYNNIGLNDLYDQELIII